MGACFKEIPADQNGSEGIPASSADLRGATPCPKHQDSIAPAGQAGEFWSALVHTPVKVWTNNEGAGKAVDKEWDKLDGGRAWL